MLFLCDFSLNVTEAIPEGTIYILLTSPQDNSSHMHGITNSLEQF